MRRADWVKQLHEAVDAAALRPFDYGQENCGLFAAQCIDAIVIDAARTDELRAQFGDAKGALAFLDREGGIQAAVTSRLGAPRGWAWARRGDVCLVPTQDGPGLGVCTGDLIAMMAPTGLTHVKIDQAIAVWRID